MLHAVLESMITSRKGQEELVAAHYWTQPAEIQEGFLRAYRQPVPPVPAEMRAAISHVVATMDDAELAGLVRLISSVTGGPAA
jgi:hypothetical protein